jgi:hypothetical protein
MPLSLKPVDASRGARWVRDAVALYMRRPLLFTMMFVVFLSAAMVVSLVPIVGGVVQMMSLPLLSLGFMVASQSALLDGPVQPGQFIEPLKGDPKKRRALLLLCALYGVCAIAILLLCDSVSHGAMQRLQGLMASDSPQAQAEIAALLSEPGVRNAALLGTLLGTALSVPFWHAPALVHWGAQSVGQALFSSTLAVWRTKGAFLVYGLVWVAMIFAFGFLSALLLGLLGFGGMGPLVALPAGLLFSTVFYISLLFAFNDSFGGSQARPGEELTPPA